MAGKIACADRLVWPRKSVLFPLRVPYSPERAVTALIFGFFIFHSLLAETLSLSADECYGIGVAHDLRASYFDHPPLSYWIIHLFLPVLGDGRAIRLPFVLIFAGTSWVLYLLTRQLFGPAAGAWAVLALNLSAFFTVAGGWALPDGPLLLCLLAAAYNISRSLFPNRASDTNLSPWRTWIVAGAWIGLAGLSKYHAVLFVIGLFVYVVTSRNRLDIMLNPAPWLGAALAIAIFSPVIIWNAEHHWASFAFQLGRAHTYGSFPKIGQFLGNFGGQVLYILPWIFVPLIVAVYQALSHGSNAERSWYCLCLGLPTILLFGLVPLWAGSGLPHWQMPGWLMLYPLLGDHLSREAAERTRPRTWAITSTALLALLTFVLVGYTETGYGKSLLPTAFVRHDPTLDFIEWTPLRDELRKRGLLAKTGLFVISGSPVDIGEIDQALGDSMPMQVFGASKEYRFRVDPKALLGRDALIMGRRDRMKGIRRALTPYFSSIDELSSFSFGRSGMKEIDVCILYGHDLKTPLPSSLTVQATMAAAP
jgi:Dolichyl-phosphate-mannose-protein mannosyltransferase